MSQPPTAVRAPEHRRLDSWKEIAAHLGRTVRTVQRWERDEGLPVHRHVHQKQSSVYAWADEIDRWAGTRAPLEVPDAQATGAPEAPDAFRRRASDATDAGLGQRPRFRALGLLAVSALLALLVVGIASWRHEARAIVRTLVRGDEAAALYRQGRAFWRQRTPRGFDQARLTFEAAIAADPGHSQAHAGLADTYSLLEAFGLMAAADALPMARREAERAVQLDPNLGEAHASLAFVLWELHDTTAAVDEMERALELDPDYATAHHWYGLFLQQFLRRHEAIAEVRRAVALDPSQPVFWTELASMLKFARRFDEAEAVLHDAQRRHPGFPEVYVLLSDLALERKDAARSVALLRRAVALGDNRPRIVARLGCLEGTTGNLSATADALHLLRELDASGQHVPGDAFAVLLALTGDLDGAFHHIQRGLNQREDWVSGVADTAGCFAPVQADARWPALRTALEQAQWLLPGSRVPALDSQVAPAPTRMINEGS